MARDNSHILIPGTWDSVTFPGKGDCEPVLRVLETGRSAWVIWVRPLCSLGP